MEEFVQTGHCSTHLAADVWQIRRARWEARMGKDESVWLDDPAAQGLRAVPNKVELIGTNQGPCTSIETSTGRGVLGGVAKRCT